MNNNKQPKDSFRVIATAIVVATKDMSIDELCAINIAMQLGNDPREVMGYDKIKHLFTEIRNGVPIAHALTQDAFAAVVNVRLDGAGIS